MANSYRTGPGGVPYWEKDPGATLDYNLDWSAWLNGDTITNVVWTVPAGLTKTTQSVANGVTTVWLAGGTLGQRYTVTCRVTTALGRTDERSFQLFIVQR